MVNVVISKGLEKGPMQIMNVKIDFAFQVRGFSRLSGSILSL